MQESCLSTLNQAGDVHQLNGNRRNTNELQQLLLLIAELRKDCKAESGVSPGQRSAAI
jgi:hypothetical protein